MYKLNKAPKKRVHDNHRNGKADPHSVQRDISEAWIFNSEGRMMWQSGFDIKTSRFKVSTSYYRSGVYFVRMKTVDNGIITHKFFH